MAEKEYTKSDIARMTLESKLLQNVAGANLAHTHFGEKGKSVYDMYMNGQEIRELQEKEYQGLKENYEKLGVVGEPNYPAKQGTSYSMMKQIEENKPFATLEDLEKIVKSISSNFKFKLPENLKKFNYSTLSEMAIESGAADKETGKLNPKKLSKELQEAFDKYNLLVEAYTEAITLQTINSSSFAELNAIDAQLNEKYHPKKKADSD